jgi:hypothetical protein
MKDDSAFASLSASSARLRAATTCSSLDLDLELALAAVAEVDTRRVCACKLTSTLEEPRPFLLLIWARRLVRSGVGRRRGARLGREDWMTGGVASRAMGTFTLGAEEDLLRVRVVRRVERREGGIDARV